MAVIDVYGPLDVDYTRSASPDYSLNAESLTLQDYSPPILPYTFSAGTWVTVANNLPISEIGAAIVVDRYPTFLDDYYYRVHINPNPLDLGSLLSTVQRDIEVWSAWFTPQALSAIDAAGNAGVVLSPPSGLNPPTTFAALEARNYSATVTLDGDATLNAAFTFHFPSDTPVLAITGQRIVAFAFRPNWDNGVTERLEWLTDVLTAHDGTEQRVGLRAVPRRGFEYEAVFAGGEHGYADVVLASWQSRVYALPVWADRATLTVGASQNSATLTAPLADYEYAVGGLAMLGTDARHTETVKILGVDAGTGTLTLERPLQSAWAAGSWIAPARLARLQATQPLRRLTAGVAVCPVRFEVQDNTNVAAAEESGTTLNGLPVVTRAPNWADGVDIDYHREQAVLDWQTGIVAVDDSSAHPWMRRQFEYALNGRSDIAAFRAWLHARQGKRVPFVMASREMGPELSRAITSADTAIYVKTRFYQRYFAGLTGRQALAFLYKDGTWRFRNLVAFTAVDDNEEILTIDSGLGVGGDPADFPVIAFAETVRLDSDTAELRWLTHQLAVSTLATRCVKG